MSSLLGNIFGLADKTKAGVKSPPTPNTFGDEKKAQRDLQREAVGRPWPLHGAVVPRGAPGSAGPGPAAGTHPGCPFRSWERATTLQLGHRAGFELIACVPW